MNKPKTIDEVITEVFSEGVLSGNGIPVDVSEMVSNAKQAIAEWIRSKKPEHRKVEDHMDDADYYGNGRFNDGVDLYEQALLADLEDNDTHSSPV